MAVVRALRFIVQHPLNRGRKVRAIVDFMRWQFGSRLIGVPCVFTWINGSSFFVRNGEAGLTGNIYTGLHEFNDMGFLLHFLRPGDLFADVGANAGSYTILACAARGARGFAFEPTPETFARLHANIRLNNLESRVQCISKAVGAVRGSVQFSTNSDATNHVVGEGQSEPGAALVEVTTLDDILVVETPILIKIDVEGWEASVLAGANAVLNNPALRALIVELNGSGHRYGFSDADVVRVLSAAGFRPFSYDPLSRSLGSASMSAPRSGNTIFVRDVEFVKCRLLESDSISIHGITF